MNINSKHFYFWLTYFILVITLDAIYFEENFSIYREVYMAFFQLSIFYSSLFVLANLKRGSYVAILKSLAFIILSFAFDMALNYLRAEIYAATTKYTLHESYRDWVIDTIFFYLQFSFYALGYYYATRYGAKQKQLRQVEQQKATAELAQVEMKQNLLQLENDFLRAQINPHFLYNTLNVFYAKAMDTNPDLADGLVKLAEVMRYSLEATDGNQLAPLQTEVGHLERVIAIHRLRFGDDLKIEFTTEGPYGLVSIAPLILITLLENALKHGDVESGASPMRLWLCVDAKHIYFTLQNKKSTLSTGEGSLGIGLANVRRRLNNVYGNGYTLEILEEADTYHVALVIAHDKNIATGAIEIPTAIQANN